jgi:colanic acid biosynthesis protein WcaH
MKIKKYFFSNEEYQKIMQDLPIVTVDVLFFDSLKSKTLLFRRVNEPLEGIFFTCGGRLLKNEKFQDAAIRIIEKELGLKINPDKLFGSEVANEIHENSVFPKTNYHCVDVYFGYILDNQVIEKIKMDEQHSEFTWFNVKDEQLHSMIKYKINSLLKKYD